MKRLSEANKQQKRAVKQKLRQEASKGATSSVGHGAFWMEEASGLESESLNGGERHELMRFLRVRRTIRRTLITS